MSFWIFVGGCPRSGTTVTGELVGQALGGQVVPESQFKNALLNQQLWRKVDIIPMLTRSTPFLLWDVGFDFLHELPDSLGVATLMDTIALLKTPTGMPIPSIHCRSHAVEHASRWNAPVGLFGAMRIHSRR